MQRNQAVLSTVCYNTLWPVGGTAASLPRAGVQTTAVGYQGNLEMDTTPRGGDGDGLLILSYM